VPRNSPLTGCHLAAVPPVKPCPLQSCLSEAALGLSGTIKEWKIFARKQKKSSVPTQLHCSVRICLVCQRDAEGKRPNAALWHRLETVRSRSGAQRSTAKPGWYWGKEQPQAGTKENGAKTYQLV